MPEDAVLEFINSNYKSPPVSEKKNVLARPLSELQKERSEMGVVDSAIQSADDIVRIIADGLTFGWADKGIGAASGTGAERERALTEESRRRLGIASPVIEIGSSLALPLGLASKGITMLGRFGTNAMRGFKGATARSALLAPEGAAYGTLSAAGHDRPVKDEAILGAIAAPFANIGFESLRSSARGIANLTTNKVSRLIEKAKVKSESLYKKALKDSDLVYSEQFVDRLGNRIRQRFAEESFDPDIHKEAAAALRKVDRLKIDGETINPDGSRIILPGKEVPEVKKVYSINSIENTRKFANDLIKDTIKTNDTRSLRLLNYVKDEIDDMLLNTQKGDIVSGNFEEAIPALTEARTTYSRIKQAEKLLKAKEDARFAGAGVNETNNTARNVRSELNRFRKQGENRSFTPEQNRMLNSQIMGNGILKNLSRLAPQRNLFGAAATAGVGGLGYSAGLNGLSALGLSLIPAGANALSNKMALLGVDDLARNVLQGGYKETAAQSLIGRARDAAVPAMMGAQGTEAVRGESPDTQSLLRALEKYKQIFLREEKK